MRLILVGLMGLLLAACQDMQVKRVESHPAVAGTRFSTYAWSEASLATTAPDAAAQVVELDDEMRAIVSAEMRSRGYREVEDKARADMVVDYQVAVIEQEFAGDPTDPEWDAQFDSNAQQGVVELPERTGAPRVVLTVGIGPDGGAAIWGGSATKLITRPESQEQRRRIIGAAVRDLLRDLPAAY
ncbi:DUF4136 domain-containing protein [Microbulbifer litoralis]|uniref:DUF4136 domain-containing protein n=1 Tax=Microbulbifer litoralis TaxID=2933965 RepID=UPI002027A3B5|nr:DUF4136 domain-containing protein [Microbulbifer sp. GX H0434]